MGRIFERYAPAGRAGAGRKEGVKVNHLHATPKPDKGKAKRRAGKDKILLSDNGKIRAGTGQPHKTMLPKFGNGLVVLKTKYDPLVQVVEDLILEGFTLFAGVAKLGKTTIFMQMAKAVCNPNGGDFVGRLARPGRVLFISLEEDVDSLQEKMMAQGWTEEEGANLTIMNSAEFFDNIGPLYTEGAIARLLKYIKDGQFLMVGVDNFKLAFKGLKFQNDSDTITTALDPIHYRSNRRHFAFVMLDHHGHARSPMGLHRRDPVEDVMSSSTKGSAPDVVIGFYDDGANKRTILARGRRVSEQKLRLVFNEATKMNARIEGDEEFDLTGRQARIVRWLRSHGAPAKNIEIAKGTGIAPSNTQPIVKALTICGILSYDDVSHTYELHQ